MTCFHYTFYGTTRIPPSRIVTCFYCSLVFFPVAHLFASPALIFGALTLRLMWNCELGIGGLGVLRIGREKEGGLGSVRRGLTKAESPVSFMMGSKMLYVRSARETYCHVLKGFNWQTSEAEVVFNKCWTSEWTENTPLPSYHHIYLLWAVPQQWLTVKCHLVNPSGPIWHCPEVIKPVNLVSLKVIL